MASWAARFTLFFFHTFIVLSMLSSRETSSSFVCVDVSKKRSVIFARFLRHYHKYIYTEILALSFRIRASVLRYQYLNELFLVEFCFVVFLFFFFWKGQDFFTNHYKYSFSAKFWLFIPLQIWNYCCEENKTSVSKLRAECGTPNFGRIHKTLEMKNKIIGDISNQTALSVPACMKKIETLLTSREQSWNKGRLKWERA